MALRGAFFAALVAVAAASTTDASASVSIAIPFDNLVKDADMVAVVTAGEPSSVWEDGRIYTYTKIKVDQGVAGEIGAGAEGTVRTMGGVVGKIGQMVDGEPVFVSGKSSLLFLHKLKGASTFEVSARAQGQYAVVTDEAKKTRRLVKSAHAGLLLPPRSQPVENASGVQTQSLASGDTSVSKLPVRLAQEVIHDRLVDDATREIAAAWRRLHPSTTK